VRISHSASRAGDPARRGAGHRAQIVDALEAAHEQGIIHRDLKPANVKVRADDTVKLLDFGLAKLAVLDASGASAVAGVSQSPTLTTPAATLAGVILGTAAYMAPEQARGKAVDKRADVWGFGCVVFEMLSGQRPFAGELISDVLASVLKTDPNWQALPVDTPAALQRLLRRCLEKDPRRRLQAIGEARVQIDDLLSGAPEDAGAPALLRAPPRWQRALPWVSTGAFAAAWRRCSCCGRPGARRRRTYAHSHHAFRRGRLTISGFDHDLAVSPDGTHVVYVGNGGTQLFVRALDRARTGGDRQRRRVRGPFVSPDGRKSASSTTAPLRRVAITGGPSICSHQHRRRSLGATWAADDTIVFATTNPSVGLARVMQAACRRC
jgi:serine/threonine-protein kinase